MARAITVANIRAANEGLVSRVGADVDGEVLWFESPDAPLRPQAEAFGCAALPVAIQHRANLVVDAPLDAVWLTNVRALQETWRQWWRVRPARIRPRAEERRPFAKARGVGLCFSGGVDSFYSLLRSGFAFDHLVYVQGYDVPLADAARAAAAEQSLREVAAAIGARAVVIRTNLREHPTFRGADWDRTHGGALAAVGHLLADRLGSLVLSSSYPYYHDTPWGSHWKIDPLWSSAQQEIVHYGAWLWRKEKLELIAGEDLVRRHLRVCWASHESRANCGRCEKCLRTMLVLALSGQLEHFPAFEGAADLAERIRALPPLSPTYFPNYEEFLRESRDPQVAEALRGLLARSRAELPTVAKRAMGLVRRYWNILAPSGRSSRGLRSRIGEEPVRSRQGLRRREDPGRETAGVTRV